MVTRRGSHVEQELPTRPENLRLPSFLSGVRGARFLVFCLLFYRSLFVFFSFFFWPLCCLSFVGLRLLITPLVSFDHCVVCPSWVTASDNPFGIFWPLCCLSFVELRLLITPLWYLLTIVLSILRWVTASDNPFGIFWPLCCLSFVELRLLITPLVSSNRSSYYT